MTSTAAGERIMTAGPLSAVDRAILDGAPVDVVMKMIADRNRENDVRDLADHIRAPLLAYAKRLIREDLGTRNSFSLDYLLPRPWFEFCL